MKSKSEFKFVPLLLGAWLTVAAVSLPPTPAFGIDAAVASGYQGTVSATNVGGGLSYLPDGDIVAFTSDFINGPTLYRFDANGDGSPAAPLPIIQFDYSSYPSFVQVSRGGTFALAGVTGSLNKIFKIDLATDTAVPYFDSLFNFDLTFIDDSHIYLSSNPGGFNPSIPNRIEWVELGANPIFRTVAEIPNTPSGPVAVNDQGDLFYIQQTYQFPAPPLSSTLFKFSAASLAAALTSGIPLTSADAAASMPVEGGADIAYRRLAPAPGELFVSTLGPKVLRVSEDTFAASDFLTINDPTGPSIGFLSMFKPNGLFDTSGPTQSILGVAVTTDFYSTYSLLQVKTNTFDRDGDKIPDSSDGCASDPAKTAAGICGCGAADTDTNFDAVVDCGSPRPFQTLMYPSVGAVIVTGTTATVILEKFVGKDVKYEIAIIGPAPKTRVSKSKTTKLHYAQFTRLKPGTYTMVFRVTNKSGRKTVKTLPSFPQQFTITAVK